MRPFAQPPAIQRQIDAVRTGALIRLAQAAALLLAGERGHAAAFFQLAIDRALNTGMYAPGGFYDRIVPGWRNVETSPRQIAWRRAVSG